MLFVGHAVCPGCRLQAPDRGLALDAKLNASGECREIYNELAGYTLAHGYERFIHQHIVDAYAAQHVRDGGPAIGPAFALAGLYTAAERGFTGRQVQQLHIRMARKPNSWPHFTAPAAPGNVTVADVTAALPGPPRDDAIMTWVRSTWDAWSAEQAGVRALVAPYL